MATDIVYKLAAGQLTLAQIANANYDLLKWPKQYPDGFSTSRMSKYAEWRYPHKQGTTYQRAEAVIRNLAQGAQPVGLAFARWFFPALTWAQLSYIETNICPNRYSALVTIVMPDQLKEEASLVTVYGYMHWPIEGQTMFTPNNRFPGYEDVTFNFYGLRTVTA